MNFIIDFYKELDTINLIIFWGIIIVVILLLIFSIFLVNKNKKLKQIIINKKYYVDDYEKEKQIKHEDIPIASNQQNLKEPIQELNAPLIEETFIENNPVEEEKQFIAEEHVMEYNKDLFSLPNIKKVDNYQETTIPNAPYQRNVLREMSSSQTSPIGIVKKEKAEETILEQAKELQTALKNEDNEDEIILKEYIENNIPSNETNHAKENTIKEAISQKKEYLTEISKKLTEANKTNEIDRTTYEIEQEKEAIISFEELMRKKDSIKIIDEEEAIISIEELLQRKKEEDKLYNITKGEENDKFISELKHFRNDL